jgi:hypothetical protein
MQLLGTTVTPGGRSVAGHAAYRIADPTRKFSLALVDEVLDNGVRVLYDGVADTIRVIDMRGGLL